MIVRLFCSDIQLDVQDSEIATLEIVNRDCFRRVINELKSVDSPNIREINVLIDNVLIEQKEMAVIFDPYQIDVNDKVYLTKIHKALEQHLTQCDDNIFLLNELSAYINMHFDNLILGYPLDLTSKRDLTFKDYLKFLEVKVLEEEQSLEDKIIQFINTNSVINFCKVIVFVNLKTFLSAKELANVVSVATRTRCPLILLENTCDDTNFDNERKLTLDNDLFAMLK